MIKDRAKEKVSRRKKIQMIMWLLLPIIVIGGLFVPYLGFFVLAMMLFLLTLSFFRGRYWCGWICPRGSFLDRIISKISLNREIPSFLKDIKFRIAVMILLMGFMIFRLIQTEGILQKIGLVFVAMCLITSVIAIPLGIIFRPRTWCAFCPMGTLQGLIGKNKYLLKISEEDCVECGICERVCTIGTAPQSFKSSGEIDSIDCVRCFECKVKCPKEALSFEEAKEI